MSVPLRPDIARTALDNVKGIQNGLKVLEFLRPGIVPNDLPDNVGSVHELKVPGNAIQNLNTFAWLIGCFPTRNLGLFQLPDNPVPLGAIADS